MINLWHRFGSRFRVTCEQSCDRKHHNPQCDPALAILLCEHGHIYVHGHDLLGASTEKRGGISRSLAALPGVRVLQDGDDGVNVAFRISDFDQVAAVMRPRHKRVLSPERKAEQTERLRKYRFAPATQADFKTLPRVPEHQAD